MAKNDNAHSIRLLDSLRRNLGNDVAGCEGNFFMVKFI